jgi:hypothetical protein
MTTQVQRNNLNFENGSVYTYSSYSSRSNQDDNERSYGSLSESTTGKWEEKVNENNRKARQCKNVIPNPYLEDGDLGDVSTEGDNFYDDLCLDVTTTSKHIPIHHNVPCSSDHSSYSTDSSHQRENENATSSHPTVFLRHLSSIRPKSRAEQQRISKRCQQIGCLLFIVVVIIGIGFGINLGLDHPSSSPDQTTFNPTLSPVEARNGDLQINTTTAPTQFLPFPSVTPTTDSGQSSQIIAAENAAHEAVAEALGPSYSQRPTKN